MQVGPGRDSGSQDAALHRGGGRGSDILQGGPLGGTQAAELLGRNVYPFFLSLFVTSTFVSFLSSHIFAQRDGPLGIS